jgi:hypothetical protein
MANATGVVHGNPTFSATFVQGDTAGPTHFALIPKGGVTLTAADGSSFTPSEVSLQRSNDPNLDAQMVQVLQKLVASPSGTVYSFTDLPVDVVTEPNPYSQDNQLLTVAQVPVTPGSLGVLQSAIQSSSAAGGSSPT